MDRIFVERIHMNADDSDGRQRRHQATSSVAMRRRRSNAAFEERNMRIAFDAIFAIADADLIAMFTIRPASRSP